MHQVATTATQATTDPETTALATARALAQAMATKTMICCQLPVIDGKPPMKSRTAMAMAAAFGAEAKKAVTGVGAPS